jgi:Fe-S-cluster containining protein
MERQSQLSPIWKPYAEAARALGVRLTNAALGPGRNSSRLDVLARRLHKELDAMMQQAFDALPGEGGIACSAGCDYCCRSLRVGAGPIEIFTLARRLRQAHGSDAELQARLAVLMLEPAPRPSSEPAGAEAGAAAAHRRGAPCPLLSGGLCLVYSSRPLACRGFVSADASICAAIDDERLVPSSTAHRLGAAAVMKDVMDALDSLGLAGRPVELTSGLALALGDDEAEKRWLRGEDVFAGLV